MIFQQEGVPDSRQDEMVVVSDSKEKSEEYRFFSEFQSHEPEFDYLSSTEIQERINVIRWIPSNSNSLSLLSTNGGRVEWFRILDKTIKLWRLSEKHIGRVPCPLLDAASHSQGKKEEPSTDIVAQNKRVFGHAHSYNIHSLSCFNDGETFISADDLRINLWNINVSNQSFSSFALRLLSRHSRHQAEQHEQSDRGDLERLLPPEPVQSLRLQHQSRRHHLLRPASRLAQHACSRSRRDCSITRSLPGREQGGPRDRRPGVDYLLGPFHT